jgi:hypothetical protein
VFPLPDASAVLVPCPSFNAYAARSPAGIAFTINPKLIGVLAVPSLTVTVIVAVPVWFAAGVTVTVRFAPLPPKTMFAFGTKVGLFALPLTVRLAAAVSTSPTVKLSGPTATPALVLWFAIGVIVGGSFTAVTVSPKLVGVLSAPSLTVTVIVAVPL